MTTFYSILAAQAHLFLHLSDMGFDAPAAAQGVAMLFLFALVGKFGFGFLADQLPKKAVALLAATRVDTDSTRDLATS